MGTAAPLPPPAQVPRSAPLCPPVPPVLTVGLAGARSHDAEPCGAHAVAGHILLRLEEDDVELGREEAAEDHGAAEAHRDAHGCGLHLEAVAEGWASGVQQRPAEGLLPPWGRATLQSESLRAPLATAPLPQDPLQKTLHAASLAATSGPRKQHAPGALISPFPDSPSPVRPKSRGLLQMGPAGAPPKTQALTR